MGEERREVARHATLERLVPGVEHAIDRRRARAGPPARHASSHAGPARPAASSACRPRRPRRTAPGRRAIRRSARCSGVGVQVVAIQHDERSTRRRSAWVARVVGAAPTCSTTSGRWRSSHAGSPISSCPAASARPAPPASSRNPLSGSASTGHPRSVAERQQRQGPRGAERSQRDHAPTAGVGRRGTPSSAARAASRFDAAVAPVPSRPPGRGGVATGTPSGHERLVERAVHVDGPGRRADGGLDRPQARVAPRRDVGSPIAGTGGSR